MPAFAHPNAAAAPVAPLPLSATARLTRPRLWLTGVLLGLLAACTTPLAPRIATPTAPAPVAPPASPYTGKISLANTEREYRRDAAQHLYSLNTSRIYQGKLPPLLYAVGVLQVTVDGQGQVRKLDWMRAPSHVPAVVAEIERTVRAAAPYPAPKKLGQVVYTDIWLWDKSGRFQLDTLTEGQRSTL
ncbi:MAG TPA: hypothetical protein VFY31_11785 [Macromonas sp.]|nr:hypothetical protein [Macromonas sp.]